MAMSNNVRQVQVLKRSSGQYKCYKDYCFAVVLYSLCYSIISPCSHWNLNTIDAIIGNVPDRNAQTWDQCFRVALIVQQFIHGCFLFFKFTLVSGAFTYARIERERYSKTVVC